MKEMRCKLTMNPLRALSYLLKILHRTSTLLIGTEIYTKKSGRSENVTGKFYQTPHVDMKLTVEPPHGSLQSVVNFRRK